MSEDQSTPNVRRTINGIKIVHRTPNYILIEMTFDGGCRTPAVAGAGCEIVIGKGQCMYPVEEQLEDRIRIRHFSMGSEHTCKEMEYEGLIIGLEVVLQHVRSTTLRRTATPPRDGNDSTRMELRVKGGSELVIRQMEGAYEEARGMKHLKRKAEGILLDIKKEVTSLNVVLEHVPRDKNSVADELANEAMDEKRSWYTVTSNTGRYHSYGNSS